MVYELITSGQIFLKAGPGVNSANSGQRMEQYANEAQAYVNARTKVDWVTDLASVGTEFSGAVSDVVSSKAAISMIAYDMSGYTSRSESRLMLNINHDIVTKGIAFLKEADHKTKMGVS